MGPKAFSMDRQRALQMLREALPDLRQRHAVKELALFGSTAREKAGPESDVDLLGRETRLAASDQTEPHPPGIAGFEKRP
jgi:predicted nucleotidyltransferase